MRELVIALARTAPLVWLVPPLGAASAAWRGGALMLAVRAALALGLALAVLPAVSVDPSAPLLLALAREIAAGLALGLVAAVPFRAAEAAGLLVDAMSPRRDGADHETRFGTLYALFALALFGATSGPARLYAALVATYEALPVGRAPAGDGAALAITTVGRLVVAAVALAAPVLLALVGAGAALALVARAAPPLGVRAGRAATVPGPLAATLAAFATAALLAAAVDGSLGGSLGALAGDLASAARALAR